jgi:hypothetical protein
MGIADAIIDLSTRATNKWRKQKKAEERDQRARERREQEMRRSRERKNTLKEAVFEVMEQAVAQTSGDGRTDFPARNLFYSVRKLIQSHTNERLHQKYFERVLKDWQDDHGPVEGMYRDPRGYFIEPRTGKIVLLGTREVEGYVLPEWEFDKLFYIEKKGMHGILKLGQIPERHDMGIICAEGYAVQAARELMARAQGRQMTIVCLHDADPWGYNIVRKIREATDPAGQSIDVIDLGLSLQDALDMGLQPETFTRCSALPQALELNDLERRYFEGVPAGFRKGRQVYRCQRVELNDLAKDPDEFNRYVERKLAEHGLDEKLVPPKGVVLDTAKAIRRKQIEDMVGDLLSDLLDEEEIAKALVEKFADKAKIADLPQILKAWAAELTNDSWRHELEVRLKERTDELEEDVSAATKKKILDCVAAWSE